MVAGLVLLGGPAWAQEDPCAPGPDGAVPEMCQSGPPKSDTGTVGMEPPPSFEECPPQPVEPGDGVVRDDGQGTEPQPGPADPEAEPERVDPEQSDPMTSEDAQREPGEDGLVCAFGIPVSAPVEDGAPETAVDTAAGNGAVTAGQLPRTGPYDRLVALTALGSGLLVAGAGALAAGRRRTG